MTIRWAVPADIPAVRRLAALDSQATPAGQTLLLAEIDGELWAVVAADGQRRLADPFRPSGDIVALLVAHAERCRKQAAGRAQTSSARAPRHRVALAGSQRG